MADRWVAECLVPMAVWILLSGLDDLFITIVWLFMVLRRRLPPAGVCSESVSGDLPAREPRRIAIFVPLWNEHGVIQKMIAHNLGAIRYRRYDFFIGAYPNDEPTLDAVRALEARYPQVHLAICPHDGPTSKADCLNWVYQRMLLFEENHGVRFEVIVTHDAEDLIHPLELERFDALAGDYDQIQIPVLALGTRLRELTHGVYCDDFAEYQTIDQPVRQFLGGFVPSCGVGCAFSRDAAERLLRQSSNRLFEPECLTEDYEIGFRLRKYGARQMFLPIERVNGSFVATREYFPRAFWAAVKQRTRWVTGIALQGWQRHGWMEAPGQIYWFWRDRKALVGNVLSPASNAIFLYGLATWAWSRVAHQPWGLGEAVARTGPVAQVYLGTLLLGLVNEVTRASCVVHCYGWRFAAGVPVRTLWANALNLVSTVRAVAVFTKCRITGQPLRWVKTQHAYPSLEALRPHKRRLGEILVGSEYVTQQELDFALATKPRELPLGAHLIAMGKLGEQELYEALSLQQSLPLEQLTRETVSRPASRALPAAVARKWQVLPFRVQDGELYVAGTGIPTEALSKDLRRFSALEVRFHLLTPSEYQALEAEFLPVAVGR